MVKIIDSIMGSGKTTYMINYMKDNPDKKFFVVTPFLSEIERIKKEVPFLKTPTNKKYTKYQDLYRLVFNGDSIITTHSLFYKLNSKMIEQIQNSGYILIIDEVADVLNVWNFKTKNDEKNFLSYYGYKDDENFLCWHNDKNNPDEYEYSSAFYDVMNMCNNRVLIHHNEKTCIKQLPISLFKSFKEIFILTYMFEGSLQKSYFDLYNVTYKLFSLKNSQLIDYEPFSLEERNKLKSLINIIDNDKMNFIGKETNALNVTWYKDNIPLKGRKNEYIKILKKHLTNFFTNICKGSKVSENLVSTFKDYEKRLNSPKWNKKYIPFNSRAINEFNHIKNLAYIVNVYPNGDIVNFLAKKEISVDKEYYALSTLIQTIFRTRIRNFDKPDEERRINLYIPSSRMRNLLIKWLDYKIS